MYIHSYIYTRIQVAHICMYTHILLLEKYFPLIKSEKYFPLITLNQRNLIYKL